ncbi:MAG: hypothetical protein QNK05_25230, partial [Myxococcota bacterium]|nr:hypothetical protein [Myxococcota bacterium]
MTKRSPSKSPLANLALVGLLAMPLIACDEPVEQPQQKLAPKIETTDRFHAKTLDEGRKKRRQIYQQMEFELIAETPEVFVAEVPIFESHDEYLSLLVEHGLEEGDPGSGGPGFTLGQQPGGGGGGDWLQPPTASGDYVIYHYTPPNPDPGFGGADGLANVGGGDGGGTVNPTFDPVGGIKGNGGSQVERWALSDGLPLRNQPDTSAGEIMILDRHDRVFVLNTPPIQNDGMVFVEVTVADRFPYPAGWFPLRWLAVGTTTDSSDEIDFAARYGLFGRLAAELFEDRFYGHCNHYPVTPHSVFEWITPTPSYPNTVPPAKRYECGELPVGDIVSASWKDIHTIDYTLPGFDVGVIKMDDIPFAIPIQHSRLGGQTRGTYEVVDLDTGWHNNQPTADLVEHEHFKTMADVDTTESAVRLHDTDVWYNVTWDAPSGVNASHADAFFNVCIQLPGGQLRGETTPHDITISGPFNTSHITGFQWGTFEYDPLEVCATAAIHDDTQGNLEHLTNAPPSPIRVEFVNARLRNVTIRQVQSTKALGSFEGVHSDIKNMLESLLNGVLGNSGVLGLLFDEFLKQGLEERILSVLVEYGASVGSNMPHPVQWTKDACDELMPQYATPASPYFPIYQHCKEASQ